MSRARERRRKAARRRRRMFRCEACGEEFEKARSDEEALAEAESAFGTLAPAERAVVCDGCWRAMREAIPEMDAELRAAGL